MAEINLKIKSDFEQAAADLKKIGTLSESTQKQLAKLQKQFADGSIDKFMQKNQLNAASITATKGAAAGLSAEYKGLQREIQRLIKNGIDPQSESIEKLKARYKELEPQVNKGSSIFKKMIPIVAALGIAFGGAAIANKIVDIGSAALKASANMEQNTVAFTTMLDSSAKAQTLLSEIQDFAAATPFSFNELVDASKRMIAFGFSAEEVTDKLGQVGNVASGLGQPVGDMIYLFGQVKTQGRAMTQDLNQFANRGVPIFEEVAKAMSVPKDKVKDLAAEGKITYSVIEQVFANMTSSGGKFAGLMEAQSNTLSGKWSNFNDGLDKTLVLLGNKLAPTAKDAISVLSTMVDSINTILEDNAKIAAESSHYTSFLATNLKLIDGTVDKLKYMVELDGVQSKEAALYLGYLGGNVKLNDKQIQQLNARLKLNRSISDIAYEMNQNELESWKQRGFIIDRAQKKAEGKASGGGSGSKKTEAQIFQDNLNVMQNAELVANEERLKIAGDFWSQKFELEQVQGILSAEYIAEQQSLIANNDRLTYEQKLALMKKLETETAKHNKNVARTHAQFAVDTLSTTGDMLGSLQTIMANAGKESKALAYTMKALAVAEATISSFLAYDRVLAATSYEFPLNHIFAGITLAAGLAKAGAIASTSISAETGLSSYTVPETRANRNDGYPVRAQAGERVTVTPRGQESDSQMVHVAVNLDGGLLQSFVAQGIRSGKIPITGRNIGRSVFAT